MQDFTWLTPYLLLNLSHGLLGLIWLGGLRRWTGSLPAILEASLLRWLLALPAIALILRSLGLTTATPAGPVLIRIDDWSKIINQSELALGALLSLSAGAALVTFIQEILPLLKKMYPNISKNRQRLEVTQNSRPHLALENITRSYFKSSSTGAITDRSITRSWSPHAWTWKVRTRAPKVIVSTDLWIATEGLFFPQIIISTAVLSLLNDDELEASIAHECAHLAIGSNFVLGWIWLIRLVQLFNPAALVAFRELVECRELACDSWASWITRKPEALASAIKKLTDANYVTLAQSSRDTHAARAEIRTTAQRIQALLETDVTAPDSAIFLIFSTALLGGLLWGIR